MHISETDYSVKWTAHVYCQCRLRISEVKPSALLDGIVPFPTSRFRILIIRTEKQTCKSILALLSYFRSKSSGQTYTFPDTFSPLFLGFCHFDTHIYIQIQIYLKKLMLVMCFPAQSNEEQSRSRYVPKEINVRKQICLYVPLSNCPYWKMSEEFSNIGP